MNMTGMTMNDLPTLLDRVRKADGPDRELDAALALAIGGWKMWKSKHGYWELANLPELTACIDAALALVEQVLPGCAFTIQRDWGDLNRCSISTDDITPTPPYVEDGQTLPLAILAALLSAIIARQETDNG